MHAPLRAPLTFHWEGYLQKRSDWLKHWETYYFVLKGRFLYCYLNEHDAHNAPDKSKIKNGKLFAFSSRVTITRVFRVEELAQESQNRRAVRNSQFRFVLETEKGHQLHFRTASRAIRQVWLTFAANSLVDFNLLGQLKPNVRELRTSISDFYTAFGFFHDLTCRIASAELAQAAAAASAATPSSNSFSVGRMEDNGATDGLGYESMGNRLSDSTSNLSGSSRLGSSSGSGRKTQTVLTPLQYDDVFRIGNTPLKPPIDHVIHRMFSLLSADVVLRSNYLPMVPFSGKYRGCLGVLDFFVKLGQSVSCHQFQVDRIEDPQPIEYKKDAFVVVVSGKETVLVRWNQSMFVQTWRHELYFESKHETKITRWEIYGDLIASSVVFNGSGSITNLVLPSLSERIRESVVGGYVVSLNLHQVTDVRANLTDRFFIRCSLDSDEGEWHTESQSSVVAPISENSTSSAASLVTLPMKNEELSLQFDRLSRDDNTLLLVELCQSQPTDSSDVEQFEVVSKTQINLANFLNHTRDSFSSGLGSDGQSVFILSNEQQSFFGKLELRLQIQSLSAAATPRRTGRLSGSGSLRSSRILTPHLEDITNYEAMTNFRHSFTTARQRRKSGSSPFMLSPTGLGSSPRSTSRAADDLQQHTQSVMRMHQFIINGVRYQLAEKYRMVKIVGKGSYGEVIAVSDFANGGLYAIKKLSGFLRHPKIALCALREIQLMRVLGKEHECLMQLHELQRPYDYDHFEDLYLIQPLMESDLSCIIHANSSKMSLNDDQIQFLVYQLICGIHFMHSANVLHRDLKPSNILVNSDCRVKICDFGLARRIQEDNEHDDQGTLKHLELSEYVVTRWYRAPELLLANTYSKAIDMWSIGCIFGELLGRKVMFPGTSYVDQLRIILEVVGTPKTFDFCDNPAARRFAARQYLLASGRIEAIDWSTLFPTANPEALDLLDKLLQFDPNKRISAAEALEHPYFACWREESLEKKCDENIKSQLRQLSYLFTNDLDTEQMKQLFYAEVMLQ